METINQLRADVVAAGVELLEKGLVAGTWGNISVRCSKSRLDVFGQASSYGKGRQQERRPKRISERSR